MAIPTGIPAADFDAFERAAWTGRAGAYADGFARMSAHSAGPLLDAAHVTAGTRVLDVGTGPGVVAAAAAARGAVVFAVDADPQMAARAAAACPDADVRTAVVPGLPFPYETFDAVVGNYVVNHFGDSAAALADLARVLRPGGRLALTCWEREQMRATAVFAEAATAAGVEHPADLPATGRFLADAEADTRPAALAALFTAAGLADAHAERLRWHHRVDPDAWWTSLVTGTPMIGSLISRVDADSAAAIRREYDTLVAEYRVPGTSPCLVDLPVAAILAVGNRK